MTTHHIGECQRTLRAWLATTLTLLLLALALLPACQGQAVPTGEPDRAPAQTNDALREQLTDLQTSEAEARAMAERAATTEQAATARPLSHIIMDVTPVATTAATATATTATAQQDATPRPSTTPLPTAIPTVPPMQPLSGANICRRPPSIQEAILRALEIRFCSAVTKDEMFRITELKNAYNSVFDPRPIELAQGHFHGLENVKALEITTGAVGPRAFEGMNSLKDLRLTVRDGHLSSQAFVGLPALETLNINLWKVPEYDDDATKEADAAMHAHLPKYPAAPWAGLTKLRAMRIGIHSRTMSVPSGVKLLKDLPELVSLEIYLRHTGETRPFTLSRDFFPTAKTITSLVLQAKSKRSLPTLIPPDLVSEQTQLTSLTLEGRWQIPRKAFANLSKLETLYANNSPRDDERHQLEIHEDSPVYKKALYGGERLSYIDIVNLPEGQ